MIFENQKLQFADDQIQKKQEIQIFDRKSEILGCENSLSAPGGWCVLHATQLHQK